ncbi:MAG: glycosyltransferase family 4 protein [Deltaproteobacteria bacterium]|nr:glycosyltransferase family 4 protein [Deltaproteobacteria bacterium]
MKALLLNTFDSGGGAAIAAYRLHKGLQAIDVDSRMLVQLKTGDDRSVSGPPPIWRKGLAMSRPFIDNIPLVLYPERKKIIFSPATIPDRVFVRVREYDPDIVHLHWIAAGFMKVESLKRLKKPIIWTLHDSWAFTGGCHIPFECTRYRQMCGACPTLASTKENDLSRKIWRRKQRAWKGLNLTVVAPSRWLAECARSSSLFRDTRVKVIPNGLDIQIFKPIDKSTARNILSLPQDKKLILFGAMDSTSDRNKGFHFLLPVLRMLSEKGWRDRAELVVFGSREPENTPDLGIKARYMGKLNDEISLAILYSAADLFVLPSIQENLPNTVMEALACGTPCIAFNQGGLPDMIEHGKNGYLAKPYETNELARGIEWVLEDDERWRGLSQRARKKVEDEFAIEKVAKRYEDLYKEIISGRPQ